jgi:hypothetical protein
MCTSHFLMCTSQFFMCTYDVCTLWVVCDFDSLRCMCLLGFDVPKTKNALHDQQRSIYEIAITRLDLEMIK